MGQRSNREMSRFSPLRWSSTYMIVCERLPIRSVFGVRCWIGNGSNRKIS